MGDRPHLSNEQELYDYYNNYGQSNESLTTTSSTSSPVNSIAQNNFVGFNWHPQTTTNFDSTMNQHRFEYTSQRQQQQHLWSSPQPQHHHYMIPQQQHVQLQHQLLHQQQQQQRQYHHMSYRSPPIMQGSPYQDPYRHYPMNNHELIQYDTSHLAADVNYAQDRLVLHKTNLHDEHVQQNSTSNAQIIPISEMTFSNYSPPQYTPSDSITSTSVGERRENYNNRNNVKNKSKNLKIIETLPSSSKAKVKSKTPSPKSTPLPSPLISSRKRKRAHDDSSRRSSICISNSSLSISQQQHEERRGEKGLLGQEEVEMEEGACNVLKEGDVNQKAVDQIENELAFLRDECATILIMLESLRNAFITDVSTSSNMTSKQYNKSALMPLTGTINFMENDNNDSTLISDPTNQVMVMGNKPRRSIVMAQNPEMEREMRIAYDDLMLQVRQLEKKVERLENKSKNACIIANSEAKQREKDDEIKRSQISNTTSINSCSEEEEDEDEISEYEFDDCESLRKTRRLSATPARKVSSRKGHSK